MLGLNAGSATSFGSWVSRWFGWNWGVRLAVLVAAMALVAGADYRRNGKSLWKAREYGGLLISSGLFGCLGMLNDALTVRLSPEYFVLGKGLDPGTGLALKASLLGGQAGFGLGFAVFGVFLLVSGSKRSDPWSKFRQLLLALRLPILAALALVPCIALMLFLGAKSALLGAFTPGLSPSQRPLFLLVWGWHLALYVGVALGTAFAALGLRKGSRSTPAP